MQPENEENKSTQHIAEEGKKVTEGENSTTGQDSNAETVDTNPKGTEQSPQSETKKEDMTSYNEHPDQEKVGGG